MKSSMECETVNNRQTAKLERWMVMHSNNCSMRVRSSPEFEYLDYDGDEGVVIEVCEDGDRWVHLGYVSPEFYEGMVEAFDYFTNR